jgi:hypothetical protein
MALQIYRFRRDGSRSKRRGHSIGPDILIQSQNDPMRVADILLSLEYWTTFFKRIIEINAVDSNYQANYRCHDGYRSPTMRSRTARLHVRRNSPIHFIRISTFLS